MQLLDLALLQTTTGYPCVSVLARRRASPADRREALATLIDEADRRLHDELGPDPSAHLVDRLRALARHDVDPTATSVGLFVGPSPGKLYGLPVEVRDRVVIDDTYATRDLVRSYQRTVAHLTVAVDAAAITLHDGNGPTLTPIGRILLSDHRELAHAVARLDGLLDQHGAERTPILVATTDDDVGRDVAAAMRHPAAHVVTAPATSTSSVAAAIGPTLELVQTTRRTAALDALGSDPVTGIRDVWRALHHRQVDLLVLEDSYTVAGRHRDGDLLLVDDPTAAGVVDDLVDDAVELAMAGGSRVEFVADRSLHLRWGTGIAARRRR